MTTADERRSPAAPYPWHSAAGSVPIPGGPDSASRSPRAGLVTRSLANVADLFVVALLVAGGYAAVAATRFLLGPRNFRFPDVEPLALLTIGLCLQALYFFLTWTVVGSTYGDRLLGLRVTDDRGALLGWGRSALRAALCTLLPIGLLWVLVSRENRSLQDLVVRTSVTYG